jgi:hypothetical protein
MLRLLFVAPVWANHVPPVLYPVASLLLPAFKSTTPEAVGQLPSVTQQHPKARIGV